MSIMIGILFFEIKIGVKNDKNVCLSGKKATVWANPVF